MTLRLTIDRARWLDHVERERTALGGAGRLVPVVKGNGYGFGWSPWGRIPTQNLARL